MSVDIDINPESVRVGNLTFNDNVKLLFGTAGADGEIYSNGTDMFFNQCHLDRPSSHDVISFDGHYTAIRRHVACRVRFDVTTLRDAT